MTSTPKIGVNKGNAGKGRPKGAVNKTTALAKEAIAQAAEGLGGIKRLIEWAKEDEANERVFWSSMYTKLIPVQTELTGKDGGAIQLEQKVQEDADAVLGALTRLTERTRAARVAGGTQH